METSIFIAKLLAVVYLAIGFGILLNQSYYRKGLDEMVSNAGIMYLGGFMALVIGFLMVTYHNIWVKSWIVLITILGWFALLKGLLLLILPKTMTRFSMSLFKKKNFLLIDGIIALILGFIFGYFGFLA